MKTIDETIRQLEMVKDDLYDHDFRTMADKINEAIKELDDLKATFKTLLDEADRHAWYFVGEPFDLPPGYVQVLAQFETIGATEDGCNHRYNLVAQYETAGNVWTRAIDHEPIHDRLVKWKYIR